MCPNPTISTLSNNYVYKQRSSFKHAQQCYYRRICNNINVEKQGWIIYLYPW